MSLKIVLDTNIWISGLLLPYSKAGEIIANWQDAKFTVITSRELLSEIKQVLSYSKIKKRTQWDEKKIEQFITFLQFFSNYISIENVVLPPSKVRDQNDLYLLKLLTESHADYLVTGDDDLLVLKQDYPILSLAEFHDLCTS